MAVGATEGVEVGTGVDVNVGTSAGVGEAVGARDGVGVDVGMGDGEDEGTLKLVPEGEETGVAWDRSSGAQLPNSDAVSPPRSNLPNRRRLNSLFHISWLSKIIHSHWLQP